MSRATTSSAGTRPFNAQAFKERASYWRESSATERRSSRVSPRGFGRVLIVQTYISNKVDHELRVSLTVEKESTRIKRIGRLNDRAAKQDSTVFSQHRRQTFRVV